MRSKKQVEAEAADTLETRYQIVARCEDISVELGLRENLLKTAGCNNQNLNQHKGAVGMLAKVTAYTTPGADQIEELNAGQAKVRAAAKAAAAA